MSKSDYMISITPTQKQKILGVFETDKFENLCDIFYAHKRIDHIL